jgi:hypothetical protein
MDQDLEKELLSFPSWPDNMVDAMLLSFKDQKVWGFSSSEKKR